MTSREPPLISTTGLGVVYGKGANPVRAVADVAFTVLAGEIVGIAGESGSGKSTLCAALIRALPRAALLSGEVQYGGRDLYAVSPGELRRLRQRELAMVLQNPMTSLDPMFTIGDQLTEVLQVRDSGGDLRAKGIALLRRVHLTAPELRWSQYPHQLSGGMKQRVLIAMAAASAPRLLVADEPTSALDATIQEEILLLLRDVRDAHGTAVIIMSHDLNALRRVCDRIVIMYAGRVVEDGPTEAVFSAPRHPYTRGLIASLPHLEDNDIVLSSIPGQVPDLTRLPDGCAFAPRCTDVLPACGLQQPLSSGAGHRVFCWMAEVSS